jgi:hypothetical protein
MWLTKNHIILYSVYNYITLMLTSPCATYVVSVKKNIVIYTVQQKHIYIPQILSFLYISPVSVIGFLARLFTNSKCQFQCAMKNEFSRNKYERTKSLVPNVCRQLLQMQSLT